MKEIREEKDDNDDYKNIERQISNIKYLSIKNKKIIFNILIFSIIVIISLIILYILFSQKEKYETWKKYIYSNDENNNSHNLIHYFNIKECEVENCEECIGSELNNICSKCNPGYKLKEGKCILNHSIKAIFDTSKAQYDYSIIINNLFVHYITEMIVDGDIVPRYHIHNFHIKGIHTIYLLMNLTECNSLDFLFKDAKELISINFTPLFNTQNITNINSMFYNCVLLKSIDFSNFNTENVITMNNLFSKCSSLVSIDLSNFNTINVEDMNGMFSFCNSLISIDLSYLNMQNVKRLDGMFFNCSKLTSINFEKINTNNLLNMNSMFYGCSSLKNINLSYFKTKNVVNMNYLFYNCNSLNEINLNYFDTGNVIGMISMLYGCNSLKNINLSNFNTKSVKQMSNMFYNCTLVTSIDLSNFDTSSLEDISHMFYNCESLNYIDVSSFYIKSSENIDLFKNISDFGVIKINKGLLDRIEDQIPVSWNIQLIDE